MSKKKEYYYGKYILRGGDIRPEQIDIQLCKQYKLTIKLLAYLESNGFLFDNKEEALKCRENYLVAIQESKNRINTVKKRIYISGPIDHHNYEERYKAFEEVENKLRAGGWEVFNPMKNGLPKDAATKEHMRRDLSELTNEQRPYSAIYLMRRWTHSKGCMTEFMAATAIGLEIVFEEISGQVLFE